ncbi:MAG: hypothetical protein JOZ64_13230 [Solirubrobacterales bacterium]|nr:hypothetical protein [Solirubrobacterales bacterium]
MRLQDGRQCPPAGQAEGRTASVRPERAGVARRITNSAPPPSELRALVVCISTALSELESRVLALYLDGHSYDEVGRRLGCDCKTVDNALQRVKRKVGQHLADRSVPA